MDPDRSPWSRMDLASLLATDAVARVAMCTTDNEKETYWEIITNFFHIIVS